MDAWGWGQTLFHRYRQVVANQKVVSNSQGNTKRTENQPPPQKKTKTTPERDGFSPELHTGKNFKSESGGGVCGGKSHCKQSYFVKLSRAKASL